MLKCLFSAAVCLFAAVAGASAQVIINEIHYHPVEEPAFQADGTPVVDLTESAHEFIEIYNAGAAAVNLDGWEISDGIDYIFPVGTTLPAGGYKVVAKNPTRVAAVYGIFGVLGPYQGVLSNGGETVKLKNNGGAVVDSVNYSTKFPWAVSADSLGAGTNFLGFSVYTAQYRGRSLERVSPAGASNDPANWLASPLNPGPSPGAANAVTRAVPKPVVVAFSVTQNADESPVIRAAQPVRVDVEFSSAVNLSSVQLEWFVDDVNSFTETRTTVNLVNLGSGRWSTGTPLPGQADRSIVRWRIKANRGDGAGELVSPRPDDPQLAAVGPGGAREAWHAYFVEPVRSSAKPIYDFFISSANVAILDANAMQEPKRVNGTYPRDEPVDGYYPPNENYNPAHYPGPNDPRWNGVVPAVFVRSGVVYDITARYHSSRYHRTSGINTWKFHFPSSKLMDGKQRILMTAKNHATVLSHALYHELGLPTAYAQYVDFYKNSESVIQRCELTDSDEEMISQYQRELQLANPQADYDFDGLGLAYKAKGLGGNEGPYGWGNGQPMAATGPWSPLDRYIHTFPSQFNDWRGHTPLKNMVEDLWAARGDRSRLTYPSTYGGSNQDTQVNVTADLPALRAYLAAHWDVDKMLTFLALRNWACPWDDRFQNYYIYQQPDGKWLLMPWDFDGELEGVDTDSIFAGRKNDAGGTYPDDSRGPNWFKDSFLRAYEAEYQQRLFMLNNSFLTLENLQAIAAAYGTGVPNTTWVGTRRTEVNTQLNLGTWTRPNQPVPAGPANGAGVVPPTALTTSAYSHSAGNLLGGNAHAKTLWEIRRSDGTFRAPVYKVASSTNLTSLPIPFALLEFGRTYTWRATFFDANNRPSPVSSESSFAFGPQPSNVTLIQFGDSWKYNHTINVTNNAWAQPGYDDSSWATGQGVLGAETAAAIAPVIRTVLPAPSTRAPAGGAYYFRRKFELPGNPATSALRIRHLIDDGCVIWINGHKVHRYMMTEQANYQTTGFATGTPPPGGDATYQYADAVANTANYAWEDPRPYLVQGTNTIAVEVHQNNGGSSDIVMGLEMTGALITNGGDVALNEILADNQGAVANGASKPDYVEIRNNTAAPVSLSGWSLSDDVLNPGKYLFPAEASIPTGGRLVVWCDDEVTEPGLHTGFGLSRSGQTVVLFQGSNLRDYVTFGPQAPNLALGRTPDGLGTWAPVAPSPGAANVAVPFTTATTTLKVNEWMAAPAAGEDWFEIYNSGTSPVALSGLWLTDTPGTPLTQIPPLSYIAAKGYLRFEADGTNTGQNHANFKLGTSGDTIRLLAANGTTTIDTVTFAAQEAKVSQGRFPDGSASLASFPLTPSPEASNWLASPVVINEALANSSGALTDTIELLNTSGSPVNIGGWWLSDDATQPQKFQIPAGTTIAGNGYLVFTEAQFNTGPNAFALSSLGDQIILTATSGGNPTGYRAQVSFGASAQDVSFGRIVTAAGAEFWPLQARTFGAANAAPITTPVIVNEIHYHPPDVGTEDNLRDEFVELHNPTTSPVDLSGWRLKNDVKWTFPAGTVLRPGDYILVVSFDPVGDALAAANFRAALGVSADTRLYGPFSPKLSNAGAAIELAQPGPLTEGATPFILVDKVAYADVSPWSVDADGSGASLQRVSRIAIGNSPANWVAAAPTPGLVNGGQTPIADNDGDGLPNTWEQSHGLDLFNAADAALDLDGDGQSNAAEFAAGTDPFNAADVFAAETAMTSGQFTVRFTAKAGKTYSIQYKNTFTDAPWLKFEDIPAPASDTVIQRTDPAPGLTKRFYRVVTPQMP